VNLVDPGRIQIWPDPMYLDPVRILRFGSRSSGSDPDPAGSEVGSSKYWLDLHNYDIKHHSSVLFQEMMHDNTKMYTKTH